MSSLGCARNRLEIYLYMYTQISPPSSCEPKSTFQWKRHLCCVPGCIACFYGYEELFKQAHRPYLFICFLSPTDKYTPGIYFFTGENLLKLHDKDLAVKLCSCDGFNTSTFQPERLLRKDWHIAVGTVAQSREEGSLPLPINYTMRKWLSAQL